MQTESNSFLILLNQEAPEVHGLAVQESQNIQDISQKTTIILKEQRESQVEWQLVHHQGSKFFIQLVDPRYPQYRSWYLSPMTSENKAVSYIKPNEAEKYELLTILPQPKTSWLISATQDNIDRLRQASQR